MSGKRISIHLNPPLKAVQDTMGEGQSLSARLGEICERYQLVCKYDAPPLAPELADLLKQILTGTWIEPLTIRYLASEVEDSELGDQHTRDRLWKALKEMNVAQRVVVLESLGL